MRRVAILSFCLALVGGNGVAMAAGCTGNPKALGVSRVMTLSAAEIARFGTVQGRTLQLADHEVVLTFDDGPLPPYTNRVLDALAAECVKATFFLVGRQANAFPDMVRRVYNAGHSIGSHSQNHPLTFDVMPLPRAEREIEDGVASVTAALGDANALAPFFRVPGLLRSKPVDDYLASRALASWNVDVDADDWTKISGSEVIKRLTQRLESKGRGIVLLHDIHPVTAMALPAILRELKAHGFHIVHVVPAGGEHVNQLPLANTPPKYSWPRVAGDGVPVPEAQSGRLLRQLSVGDPELTRAGTKRQKKLTRRQREPATTASVSPTAKSKEPTWRQRHREIILVR